MKTMISIYRFKLIFVVLILALISQGCLTAFIATKVVTKSNSREFDIEQDLVSKSKKITIESEYFDIKYNSPLLVLKQAIVKEIKANNDVSYKIYDLLCLRQNSFAIIDTLFLIIGTEVFALAPMQKEIEVIKDVSVSKSDVMASDSTKTTVMSGYSENNEKIIQYIYNLSVPIVNKIKSSEHVTLQYYAGYKIIRIEIYKDRLNRLKRFLEQV